MKDWIENNADMNDVLIGIVLLVGLIAACLGIKEALFTAIGAASNHIIKDNAKATKEAEAKIKELDLRIKKERAENDELIKVAVEEAKLDNDSASIDDLIARANERIRRSKT